MKSAAHALLPVVLPMVCAWARRQERLILARGEALTPEQALLAAKVGVREVARVRLLAVATVPPTGGWLRGLGDRLRVAPTQPIGMTLRYGIFIQAHHLHDRRLLAHELAHVVQYERLGGFAPFLRRYLQECIIAGYPHGELEQEAKRAERLIV